MHFMLAAEIDWNCFNINKVHFLELLNIYEYLSIDSANLITAVKYTQRKYSWVFSIFLSRPTHSAEAGTTNVWSLSQPRNDKIPRYCKPKLCKSLPKQILSPDGQDNPQNLHIRFSPKLQEHKISEESENGEV